MDTMELREAFRADAQLAGPPPMDPYESVLARRQKSDRRRLATLTAGLAVVTVVVLVPFGISLVGPRDSQVAASPEIPYADVFAAPTRGSLAEDAAFVDGVRQLSWAVPDVRAVPALPDAPVDTRSVVFAGDVADGRWALVIGANNSQPTGEAADPNIQTDVESLSDIAAVWFVGPAGAAPEQMEAASLPRGVAPDLPTSLYDGPTGALVVIAAPGDSIEVSPRPEVTADATVTRSYTDTGSTDGVAVVALDPNPFSYAGMPPVQYRVTRGGVVIVEQAPDSSSIVKGPTQPAVQLQYLRSQGVISGPGDMAQIMAAEVLTEYGLSPAEVELYVHYVGSVPGPNGEPAGLTVLTVTFPSGAVLTRATWMQPLGGPQGPNDVTAFAGGPCVYELSAAGVPVSERILAIRCDVNSGREDPDTESTLVVLVPVGLVMSSLTALGDGGSVASFLGQAAGDGGVVMVPFPEGADRVVVELVDGTILDEVPISAP